MCHILVISGIFRNTCAIIAERFGCWAPTPASSSLNACSLGYRVSFRSPLPGASQPLYRLLLTLALYGPLKGAPQRRLGSSSDRSSSLAVKLSGLICWLRSVSACLFLLHWFLFSTIIYSCHRAFPIDDANLQILFSLCLGLSFSFFRFQCFLKAGTIVSSLFSKNYFAVFDVVFTVLNLSSRS